MTSSDSFDQETVEAAASIAGVEIAPDEQGKVAERLADLMASVHALDHLDLECELPSGQYDPTWDDE